MSGLGLGVTLVDMEEYIDYWESPAGHDRLRPEPPTCSLAPPVKQAVAGEHRPHQRHFGRGLQTRQASHDHVWAGGRREAWTDSCTCAQIQAWKTSQARRAFLETPPPHTRCMRPPKLPENMYSFCPISYFSKNSTERNQAVFQHVHAAFRKHRIAYTINDGGLIGAIRHAGRIPWDDDLDIYVEFAAKNAALRVLKGLLGTTVPTDYGSCGFTHLSAFEWGGRAKLHLPGGDRQDAYALHWQMMRHDGPKGAWGGVEIYFDSPYHDGNALLHLHDKRDNFWPPRLAPYGDGIAFIPNWAEEATRAQTKQWWARYGDVHKTCIVVRHGTYDATQFENNLGGPTKRPCDNLRPHFEFAFSEPDICRKSAEAHASARASGAAPASLSTSAGWGWACSVGAT